jgi:hypothetical protein
MSFILFYTSSLQLSLIMERDWFVDFMWFIPCTFYVTHTKHILWPISCTFYVTHKMHILYDSYHAHFMWLIPCTFYVIHNTNILCDSYHAHFMWLIQCTFCDSCNAHFVWLISCTFYVTHTMPILCDSYHAHFVWLIPCAFYVTHTMHILKSIYRPKMHLIWYNKNNSYNSTRDTYENPTYFGIGVQFSESFLEQSNTSLMLLSRYRYYILPRLVPKRVDISYFSWIVF